MNFVRFPNTETIPSKVDRLIDIHLSKAIDIQTSNDTTDPTNCFFVGGPISSLNVLQRLDNSPASYINIDKGYLRSGKATTHWRLTLNGLQQCWMLDVPDDRLQSFNIDIKPWQSGGDYILILAPNPKPLLYYTGSDDVLEWCLTTKRKLLDHTDRKIFIRFKESVKNRINDPLTKYLKNCYAVVTLQSIGCVETISKGIPTLNLAPSCLDCLYESKIEIIENIPKPENRYEWLKTLSYSQFTIDEIERGCALNKLKERI
jgi:hypothetical protein